MKNRTIRHTVWPITLWLALVAVSYAVDATWNGNTNGTWSTTTNWSASPVPGTGNIATFNAASSNTTITTGAITIDTILFNTASAAAYTLGPAVGTGTITLNHSGDIIIDSTVIQNQLINANLVLGTNRNAASYSLTNESTVGTLSLAGTVAGGTTATQGIKVLNVAGAGDTSISGIISNGGATNVAITKTGAGTLTLSGVNTHTGVTTISGGVLSVATIGNGGVAGNLGQATNVATNLVIGNGTLRYTGATASTNRAFTITAGQTATFDITANNLAISGASAVTTGALTKIGAGTLTLSGANGHTGLTTVSAGTLQYGVNNAISSGGVTVSGGIFDINTFSDTVGTVTLASGSITGSSGVLTGSSYAMQNGSVSAILGGSGALTKTTADTVTLSGASTYTGATTISGGTLFANNASGSATGTGAVSVGSGGTLRGNGTITPTGTNGINVSGVLFPGDGISTDTLTFNLASTSGGVTMSNGAGLAFRLGLPGVDIVTVGVSDLLALVGAGAADFAFNNNVIDFQNTGTHGYYKLFDTSSNNANTWTGLTIDGSGLITGGLSYINLGGGNSANLIMGGGSFGGTSGDIYLQVIPEPSSLLLFGPAALLLVRRRREG